MKVNELCAKMTNYKTKCFGSVLGYSLTLISRLCSYCGQLSMHPEHRELSMRCFMQKPIYAEIQLIY